MLAEAFDEVPLLVLALTWMLKTVPDAKPDI